MEDVTIKKSLDALNIKTEGEIHSRIDILSSNVEIDGTKSKVNCYMLRRDSNNNYRQKDLIEYIKSKLLEYSIPKKELDEANEYYKRTSSLSKITALHEKAKQLFTDLDKTGEGGEVLLYILIQEFLKIPQLISKMSLKTSENVHYHGADGIHVNFDSENKKLNLYWAESKMYAKLSDAISSCFKSIKGFLLDEQGYSSTQERDLELVTANIANNINNEDFEDYLVKYFDKDNMLSNYIEYKGICFIGFDSKKYPDKNDLTKTHAEVYQLLQTELEGWYKKISMGIEKHANLHIKEIHVFLMPFPSVAEFREEFLKRLNK